MYDVPQPYPLACRTEDGAADYLVLGWSTDGKPVVVRNTYHRGYRQGVTSEPHVLDAPARYYLPATNVSVDGDITASVSGEVDATVEGRKANGGMLVYGPGD